MKNKLKKILLTLCLVTSVFSVISMKVTADEVEKKE